VFKKGTLGDLRHQVAALYTFYQLTAAVMYMSLAAHKQTQTVRQ